MHHLIAGTLFFLTLVQCPALTNGLCLKPTMGWDPFFGGFYTDRNFTEVGYREMASALRTNGMYDAGYRLIQVTDCWWVGWSNNTPMPDPAIFPSGMKPLYDYLHSLGLEAGMYMMAGGSAVGVCARTGALGYETNAANAFAAWGVDWLMWDVTSLPHLTSWSNSIVNMGNALKSCGRPIALKTGHGTFETVYPWLMNLCRYDQDLNYRWTGITRAIDNILYFRTNVTQGFFLDPDDLFIGIDTRWFLGTNSLTAIEWNSQFAMWCMFSAPLIVGCDLRGAHTNAWFTTITNADLVAIDQDAAAVCANRISQLPGIGGNLEVWSKPLANGGQAYALFNRSSIAADISVAWSGAARVRDCWAQKDLGTFISGFTTNVASHGVAVIKVDPLRLSLSTPAIRFGPDRTPRLSFGALVEPGRSYVVQSSADLVTWSTRTRMQSSSNLIEFSDVISPHLPARFYRVISE